MNEDRREPADCTTLDDLDGERPCSNPGGHSWVTEEVEHGEGRTYCEFCLADGDA